MQCTKYLYDYYNVRNEHKKCIPFESVWALFRGSQIAVECLQQLICVLNFFCQLNNTFVYDLDINNIYIIHEFDKPRHVFLISDEYQYGYTMSEQYGIRLDWDKIRFHRNSRSESFHFIRSQCRQSLFLQLFSHVFQQSLDSNHPLHGLHKTLDRESISPRNQLLILDDEWTPLLWQLIQLPLPNLKTKAKDIENQLSQLLKRIITEYEKLTQQFKDQNNGKIIITEWHTILRAHDKEFWEIASQNTENNLDKFIKRLRNYLYQLLVDHHYQHVQLKKIDFKSLIVACYLWASEYSKWISRFTFLFKNNDKADSIFLMIMDLFITKDTMNVDDKIFIITCNNNGKLKKPITISATQELIETHPNLRPQFFLHDHKPYK